MRLDQETRDPQAGHALNSPAPERPGVPAVTQAFDALEHVIVAVHGIGDQQRGATIRAVARYFGDGENPKLPIQPLGYFNVGSAAAVVHVSRFDVAETSPLRNFGLVEVYWADIPRGLTQAGDTLEETKQWTSTVASRAHAMYDREIRSKKEAQSRLTNKDFELGANVLDEIVETISVLEHLLSWLRKLNLFEFDLGPVLRDYVNDVQVVTEFSGYRHRIMQVFHDTMRGIVASNPATKPKLYIVGHSEGSVISFLGLLQALTDRWQQGADTGGNEWVTRVHGFMTIGSPIDKHIVLWSQLFEGLKGPSRWIKNQQIKWRNYYDLGDPVGFNLDSARKLLLDLELGHAFQFEPQHDIGFERYWLPGKAHTDYWEDAAVFDHFFGEVIETRTACPQPTTRRLPSIASTWFPYLCVLVLHLFSVWLLGKGLAPLFEPGRSHFSAGTIAAIGCMLTGSTVSARIPRLLKGRALWVLFSLGLCSVSLLPAAWWLPDQLPALCTTAYAIAASGWFAPAKPRWGRRALLGAGLVAVAFWIWHGRHAATSASPPLWPMMLAAAAALYAWWFGILFFDLTFIWHRYIRKSVAIDMLRAWSNGEDPGPGSLKRRGASAQQATS